MLGRREKARGLDGFAAEQRIGPVLDQQTLKFLPPGHRAFIAGNDPVEKARREIEAVRCCRGPADARCRLGHQALQQGDRTWRGGHDLARAASQASARIAGCPTSPRHSAIWPVRPTRHSRTADRAGCPDLPPKSLGRIAPVRHSSRRRVACHCGRSPLGGGEEARDALDHGFAKVGEGLRHHAMRPAGRSVMPEAPSAMACTHSAPALVFPLPGRRAAARASRDHRLAGAGPHGRRAARGPPGVEVSLRAPCQERLQQPAPRVAVQLGSQAQRGIDPGRRRRHNDAPACPRLRHDGRQQRFR